MECVNDLDKPSCNDFFTNANCSSKVLEVSIISTKLHDSDDESLTA